MIVVVVVCARESFSMLFYFFFFFFFLPTHATTPQQSIVSIDCSCLSPFTSLGTETRLAVTHTHTALSKHRMLCIVQSLYVCKMSLPLSRFAVAIGWSRFAVWRLRAFAPDAETKLAHSAISNSSGGETQQIVLVV